MNIVLLKSDLMGLYVQHLLMEWSMAPLLTCSKFHVNWIVIMQEKHSEIYKSIHPELCLPECQDELHCDTVQNENLWTNCTVITVQNEKTSGCKKINLRYFQFKGRGQLPILVTDAAGIVYILLIMRSPRVIEFPSEGRRIDRPLPERRFVSC